MSQDLTDMVWDAVGIRSTPRLVLLRLARHANPDGGSIFPSVASLCDATALTPPTVRAALMELQNIGVLALVAMEDPVTHRPREYRIALERLAALRGTPAKDLPHPRKEFAPTPASDLRGGGKILSFPPQGVCPIPAKDLPPTPAKDLPLPHKEFAPSPQIPCPIPAKDLPHPRKEFAPTYKLKEKALSAKLEVNGEEGGIVSVSAIIAAFDEARVAAFGDGARRAKPSSKDEEVAAALIDLGATLDQCERVFAATQDRRKRSGQSPIDSVSYFFNRIKELIAAESVPFPDVSHTATGTTLSSPTGPKAPEPLFGKQSPATRPTWRTRLAGWRSAGMWFGSWGPKPSEPDCEAPADLVAEILPQPELL